MNAKQKDQVIAFYTAEALQVHALCDRVNVPRHHEGSELSMAQRVAIAVGVLEHQLAKVGMARTQH